MSSDSVPCLLWHIFPFYPRFFSCVIARCVITWCVLVFFSSFFKSCEWLRYTHFSAIFFGLARLCCHVYSDALSSPQPGKCAMITRKFPSSCVKISTPQNLARAEKCAFSPIVWKPDARRSVGGQSKQNFSAPNSKFFRDIKAPLMTTEFFLRSTYCRLRPSTRNREGRRKNCSSEILPMIASDPGQEVPQKTCFSHFFFFVVHFCSS